MNIFKRHKTIEEMIPGFLLERETQGNLKTSMSYHSHIYVFVEWLKSKQLADLPMRRITSQDVADFFLYLAKEKGLDKPTCEKYFLHNRLLFVYAQKREEIDIIPFDLAVLPRKGIDKSAEVIHPEHLKLMLPEIKRVDPQLYLGCMIQYYCFIRPGRELRLLKVGDIDLIAGTITIRQEHAKNNTRQIVTMPNQLIELCLEYGIDTADKNLYIFGKKHKFGTKPICENTLRWNFNKVRDRLNMPTGYKFYSFKHTGASNLHLSGISMRELMDQLRHTKLDATQHYLKKHCGIVNDRIRDNFPSPI